MTRDTVARQSQITAREKSGFGKGRKLVEGSHEPVQVVGDPIPLADLLDDLRLRRIPGSAPLRHLDLQVAHGWHDLERLFEVRSVVAFEDARFEHLAYGSITLDQLGRCSVADARDPGQAVRRIAPEDCEVGVGAAWNAVAPRHLGLVDLDRAPLLRIQHDDLAAAYLAEQVAVTARDLDRRLYLRGQSGDDVLGLISRQADDVYAHCLQ